MKNAVISQNHSVFGTPGQARTAGVPLRSEVEPMNHRVPQYPYTFYCEILTQNSL